jgi:outer membrane protein OmpA-like peptidoglycan-associated protein
MSEHEQGAEGEKKDAHGGHGGGGGHGKKHHHGGHGHHEEHEEGWIVSFADNVLLMMGFFVILLAMNMGPKATGPETEGEPGVSTPQPSDQMLDFAIAVREAFHNPVDMESQDPEDQPLIRRLRQRAGLDPSPDSDAMPTHSRGHPSERPADWHGMSGFVEFGDNSIELSDASKHVIRQLAERLIGTRWIIEVRGHSSRLESWGDERKGRELSYKRAWAVGQELVHQGVRWSQIQLIASGDVSPVTPRASTADEHMTNQRVEIMVTPKTEASDPYSQRPAGESAVESTGE